MATVTPPPANYVASKVIRITLNVVAPNGMADEIQHQVEYLDDNSGFNKPLPRVGDPHPGNGRPIEAEHGTGGATAFAHIKWHHHSDCITIDIGGAQYQVCWP